MANSDKAQGPHCRIVVGLPDIQDQLRLVDRLSASASEPELGRLNCLGNLLSELYAQLQHKKQVTIFRFGSKSTTNPKTGRHRE
ncbi:MAG: hypothetical protein NTY77_09190 [Elusimicrobia bacterium]|nr:hypothetical protein [Elusimicrobiota bacterium]